MAVMGAIAGVMAVVGAVSNIGAARQEKANAKAAAQRVEVQRNENINIARTQSAQQEANRLQKLKEDIGSQKARGAAYGFSTSESRSFQTIQQQSEKNAAKDIKNIRLQFLISRQRELFAISDAKANAKAVGKATTFKILGAAAQGIGGAAQIYNSIPSGVPDVSGGPLGKAGSQAGGSPFDWEASHGEDGW